MAGAIQTGVEVVGMRFVSCVRFVLGAFVAAAFGFPTVARLPSDA